MSQQPDFDALNQQRIWEKFRDLAALGWAQEKCEARGIPLDHETLHRMADDWKATL